MNIVKIVICFLMQILLFFQLGYLVNTVFMKQKKTENFAKLLVLGFLSYFSLFQIIAFPMILLKIRLSTLSVVWGVISLAILIIPIFKREYRQMFSQIKIEFHIIGVIAAALVIFQVIYAVAYPFFGWDTLSYIGRINAALRTDTMFLYTGDEGIPYPYLNFKHCLSTYYMNSAVFCQIFHLSGYLFQNYVGGSICILFAYLEIYTVTEKIINKKIAVWTVVFLSVLRFFFSTWATTDSFLLARSYESKAYCGNVVLPLIFGTCIMLWKDYHDKNSWKLLFLSLLSSVPISMSCIVSAPVLMLCMIIPLVITEFDKIIIKRMLLCLIPNTVWCILYTLYFIKIIQINGVIV